MKARHLAAATTAAAALLLSPGIAYATDVVPGPDTAACHQAIARVGDATRAANKADDAAAAADKAQKVAQKADDDADALPATLKAETAVIPMDPDVAVDLALDGANDALAKAKTEATKAHGELVAALKVQNDACTPPTPTATPTATPTSSAPAPTPAPAFTQTSVVPLGAANTGEE